MKYLHQVLIDGRFNPTGKTRHSVGGAVAPAPARLVIAQATQGYYLLHIDEHGEEITDTFHDSVGDAMKQAG